MRHLTPQQAVTNLQLGKVLEQWLGAGKVENEPTLLWVEVSRLAPGQFRVALYEALDDEEKAVQGLYSLYSPVRDPKWGSMQFVEDSGRLFLFEDAGAAVEFVVTIGGRLERFVNKGFLYDEYVDWRAKNAADAGI